MSEEIVYIDYDEALTVYGKMIDASDGGFEGVRDEGGIRATLDFVQNDLLILFWRNVQFVSQLFWLGFSIYLQLINMFGGRTLLEAYSKTVAFDLVELW